MNRMGELVHVKGREWSQPEAQVLLPKVGLYPVSSQVMTWL